MATAVELQHELARRGQHRVPIPDLVISAAAAAGLIVLHHDRDFPRLTAAGGAPHEWVVTQGSASGTTRPATANRVALSRSFLRRFNAGWPGYGVVGWR